MTQLDNHPRTRKDYVRIFFTGAAMGTADPIPGVSGGTMAFILGIYEDLLKAIKSFNLDLLKLLLRFKFKEAAQHVPWQFLLTLGLGLGSAFLLLANIISWLLIHQRVNLFAFFFGLILASVIAIGTHIKWSPRVGIMCVVGVVVALFIVTRIPADMPNDPLTLFLSGSIAIIAMILPGISGSFILLILGQYEYVINAVRDLDILTLLPVALGSILGLLVFARLLSWLLKNYEYPTLATLVGFMIGSLYEIWPWKMVLETRIDSHGAEVPTVTANVLPELTVTDLVIPLVLCAAGFMIVSFLDHLHTGSNPIFSLGRNRREVVTVKH